MKYIICIALLLSLSCSCADHWNDHYDEQNGGMEISDKNILEYLEGKPEYSNFVRLLKETRVDSILKTGKRYSVWVPGNENLPDLAELSDSLKYLTLENHITWGDYYNAGFQDGLSLRSYSGKRLRMHELSTGMYAVNDKKVTKVNMACRDGVVHEIDGLLELKPTVYDYLMGEEDYALLRQVMEQFRDSVFDASASEVVDTNMFGELVYDSVFNPIYQIYNQSGIKSDDDYSTLFLTGNVQLQEVMDGFFDNFYLLNPVSEPTAADTANLYGWIARSCIHRGLIEDYGEKELLTSVFGTSWRTDYEELTPGSMQEFSNGLVYDIRQLVIPWQFLRHTAEISVMNIFNEDAGNIGIDTSCISPLVVTKEVKHASDGVDYLLVTTALETVPEDDVPPFTFRMSMLSRERKSVEQPDGSTVDEYFPLYVTPGQYAVTVRFVKPDMNAGDFRVYVNDTYIATIKMAQYKETNKVITEANIGTVDIGKDEGLKQVKVTFESVGTNTSRPLAVNQVTLTPSVNNNY